MKSTGLFDMHCHIVPCVDDGAASLEEAVKMVEAEYKQGVRRIIVTPHFRKGMFEPSALEVKKQFQLLRKTVWEINKDIRLYLGCELYASEDMISQLDSRCAVAMAGSKYVLTELHEFVAASQVRRYLGLLLSDGYRPVIAHAERYECMRKDIKLIEDMIAMGALIQLNADSIVGKNGYAVRKFCKKLLKEGKVHFVGSDCHGIKRRVSRIGDAHDYICKKYGKEYADEIFVYNPQMILENARQRRAGIKRTI